MKWLVAEEDSIRAEKITTLPELVAPDLMLAEVGNALWKKVRNGEIAPDGVAERIESLPLLLDDVYEIAPRLVPAFRIARQLDHPVYDCIYIALALELGVRLVTADMKLIAKCREGQFAATVITMEEALDG